MLPNGLQVVGNGVSLLPWRKMTGTCEREFECEWRVRGAPKPITGTPK
jgi:hypothetical protein